MYMASISGLGSLRSSMRSISGSCSVLGGPSQVGRGTLLAILWLRMSSSLTVLSMSFLLASSKTRTFH